MSGQTVRTFLLGMTVFLLLHYFSSSLEEERYLSSMSAIEVRGVRIAYRIVSNDRTTAKPTVVFLHGFNSSSGIFEPLAEALRTERRCVLIDLPPFGASDRSQHVNVDVKHVAEYVIGLLDELGIVRFSLVGHSMGAHIAMLLASWRPERVERLVLISPAYPFPEIVRKNMPEDVDSLSGYLKEIASTFELNQKLYPLRAFSHVLWDVQALLTNARYHLKLTFDKIFVANKDLSGQTMIKFVLENSSAESTTVDFSAITARTLVVHGENDKLVPPEFGEFLSWQIKNAQLLKVPTAGHYPFLHEFGHLEILKFLLNDKSDDRDSQSK